MNIEAQNKFYDRKITICDGHVLLYTKKGAQKARWSARVNLPGRPGYVVRSLKTTSEEEALIRGREVFNELKDRDRLKLPLKKMKFSDLFHLYREWRVSKLDEEGNKRRRGYLEARLRYYDCQYRCYWGEYMGDLDILELVAEPSTLLRYGDWRLEYWKKHATPQRIRESNGRHRETPAYGTILNEVRALKSLFYWANTRRYIDLVPHIPHPAGNRNTDRDSARFGSFDLQQGGEWSTLCNKLNSWTNAAYQENSQYKHQRWPRERMRAFILIVANSGLRATECLNLRHVDCELRIDEFGEGIPVFNILSGKVGRQREVVALDNAWKAYQRLVAVSRYTAPTDYVFANAKGERLMDMSHTHKRLLEKFGMRRDKDGRRRTLTSYRHVYATFRLQLGQVPIASLAQNMGTSVKMIERHYSHVLSWNIRDVLRANSVLRGKGLPDEDSD